MPAHSYDMYSNVPAKHPYETLCLLQICNTQLQFVTAVQSPSRKHSKTNYPIKRLHYASPSFTRRQYKRASVSGKLRGCAPGAKHSDSGWKRNTSSFLSDEVYETRFHDRDVKARSRVLDAISGFSLCPARTLITRSMVQLVELNGPAEV